jgi:hypothetical protein
VKIVGKLKRYLHNIRTSATKCFKVLNNVSSEKVLRTGAFLTNSTVWKDGQRKAYLTAEKQSLIGML